MIGYFRKDESTPLDKQIAAILEEMDAYGPDSDEFQKQLNNLERMMKLKRKNPQPRISPDTLAVVIGNLIGILVIVAYEQKHVMTTRAWGFLVKKNP